VFLLGNPFGERLGRWIGFENRIAAGFYGLIATGFFVVKFAGFAVTLGFALLILPVWLSQLETGQLTENSGQWVLMAQAFKAVAGGLPFVVVALVVSHGISFVVNFIGRREYDRTNILLLVFWPYARMALIVAVMIIAGVAAALTPVGRTTLFAVTVVSLKLLADLASHAFEHVGKPTVPPRLHAGA
jgi:hypothetical protein